MWKFLIISYDVFQGSDFDYQPLHKAIVSYGDWFHLTDSTWMIYTEKEKPAIEQNLRELLPDGSPFVVLETNGEIQGNPLMTKPQVRGTPFYG